MTSPINEICKLTLKPTTTPTSVPTLQSPLFASTLSPAPGFLGLHWGFEIENPTVLRWFIQWASLDSHRALAATPGYRPFVEKILSFSSAGFVHAPVSVPEAPVLEIVEVTLKEGADREGWEGKLGLVEGELKKAPGYKGATKGWVLENERVFVIIVGWESVAAHFKWKDGYGEEEAGRVFGVYAEEAVEGVEMVHVNVEGWVGPN